MDMKRRDPRSLAALPDLDAGASARVENDELMVEERKAQRDFREVATQTRIVERLSLLWESRLFLGCVAVVGLLLSTLIVLLIPNSYESSVRLMPPDNPSSAGLAQAALALAGGTAGLGESPASYWVKGTTATSWPASSAVARWKMRSSRSLT